MKVIIREETKLGSGTMVDVYEYNTETRDDEQLYKLIDKDEEWFNKVHIPIDEEEVWDDEACIYGSDYVITYYIRDVKGAEVHG